MIIVVDRWLHSLIGLSSIDGQATNNHILFCIILDIAELPALRKDIIHLIRWKLVFF